MTETKFTPGPWRNAQGKGSTTNEFRIAAGDVMILDGCGCCFSPWLLGSEAGGDDEAVANGRLMVAAPDLYAALVRNREALVAACEHVGMWPEACAQIQEADAALSRARGEAAA